MIQTQPTATPSSSISNVPCKSNSLLNDSNGNLAFDLQTLGTYEDNDESFVEVNADLERRALLRRKNSLVVTTVNSRQRQIREALDIRNMSIVNDLDSNEFKRVQEQLRGSGINTAVGTLQFLDKKVTEMLIEQRQKENKDCLDQRVNKRMMRRRRTTIPPIDSQPDADAPKGSVLRRFTCISTMTEL